MGLFRKSRFDMEHFEAMILNVESDIIMGHYQSAIIGLVNIYCYYAANFPNGEKNIDARLSGLTDRLCAELKKT